jgi:hypothetical protein
VWLGVLVVSVTLALPLGVRRQTQLVFLGIVVVCYAGLTGLLLFTAWWARRFGIPNNADLRSLGFRSSSDRRFWRRPQMAKHLAPPESAVLAKSPQTPAEYVRSLAAATQRMTGQSREAGVRGVEVARLACAAIERLDGELEQLKQGVGPCDADLPDRRIAIARSRERLGDVLEALWAEQVLLSRENSAAAVHRFTGIVTSFAQEVVASGTPAGSGDSAAMSPTCAAASEAKTHM